MWCALGVRELLLKKTPIFLFLSKRVSLHSLTWGEGEDAR